MALEAESSAETPLIFASVSSVNQLNAIKDALTIINRKNKTTPARLFRRGLLSIRFWFSRTLGRRMKKVILTLIRVGRKTGCSKHGLGPLENPLPEMVFRPFKNLYIMAKPVAFGNRYHKLNPKFFNKL
ncbi:MAG: hypothetical protein GWM98_07645 [Nitrospinaceae bacterium]|nr:hypothetical protein [Nitrospinaceae bacterium]NIR54395.1 hypothetical protein [Nitrospinaceae bacterium]NIS84809.1 hypothetical protein [Nitrospinaceae bacterium]NIT81614.1 hypothetical protein [Nitrospinaceae bacterium]NIU43897.1 hypothetical protein [Nitrospinaceae bacterium]